MKKCFVSFISGMVFGVTLVSYLTVVEKRRKKLQKSQKEEDDFEEDYFEEDLDEMGKIQEPLIFN